MHRASPYGGALRRRAPLLAAALGIAALLSGTQSPLAGGPSRRLPGRIPKSPPFVAGFPIPFPRPSDYRARQGSVVPIDLGKESGPGLVVSLSAGLVTLLRPDATGVFQPADGWPRTFEDRPQPAYPLGAPGVGDLDGDGIPEIVTCVVSGNLQRQNFLYAFHADGSDLKGWPVEILHDGEGYYSCSPAGVLLADLDGDGRPEVVRGMNQGEVQAFSADGLPLPGWPFQLGLDSFGRPRGLNADLAAADLDGDGADEVIVTESGFLPRLVAVPADRHRPPVFLQILPSLVERQAPVVGDLNGDGHLEIVQSTLPFTGDMLPVLPYADGRATGRTGSGRSAPDSRGSAGTDPVPPFAAAEMIVLRADGSPAAGWPRTLASGGPWGAVLADLDGDGHPEILQQDGGLLYAFDATGGVVSGFPQRLHRDFLRSQAIEESPWLATDLDGDRKMELIQARSDLYAGFSYLRLFGLRGTGQPVPGFPFEVEGLLAASPPVAVDLNRDGVQDLVMLTTAGPSGPWSLVAWDLGARGHGRL